MKQIQDFLVANEFKQDKKSKMAYGVVNGYLFTILYAKTHKQYLISLNAKVSEDANIEGIREDFLTMANSIENVHYINYNENIISMGMQEVKQSSNETLTQLLKKLTSYLKSNGFVQTCRFCDQTEGLSFYRVQGKVEIVCPECSQKIIEATNERSEKPENIGAGIVGALLGALIGVVAWCVVYQLGFIVSIIGYLMVVCAIKGYEKFAGNLSKKGLWIAVAISIVMLFAAEFTCLVIEIYNNVNVFGYTVLDSIRLAPTFLSEPEVIGYVVKDIAIGLIFMIVASTQYIKSIHQHISTASEMERLG